MECKTPENEFIHNFPNLDKSQQISYTSLLKYNSASTQTFFGKTFCFKNIMFDASMPRLQESPLKKSPKWTNLQIRPESLEFEKW